MSVYENGDCIRVDDPSRLTPYVQPLQVGDEVRIRFWDHTMGGDDPYEFYVYGRIAKITDRAITVDSWAHSKKEHDRVHGDEVETFCIVRVAIESIDRASWTSVL